MNKRTPALIRADLADIERRLAILTEISHSQSYKGTVFINGQNAAGKRFSNSIDLSSHSIYANQLFVGLIAEAVIKQGQLMGELVLAKDQQDQYR